MQSDIDGKFENNFNDLNEDILDINKRKESILAQIREMENDINRIQNIILSSKSKANPPDPMAISKLYSSLSHHKEMLNGYYDTYRKYLDTKFKYRQESSSLKLQLIKLVSGPVVPDNPYVGDFPDEKDETDIDTSF
jgi:predicted  nucleic acid-binding Zn-ribbon protein